MLSVTQDEKERVINRSRRMYQTDMDSNLATAENRGRREGMAQGALEIARKMKSMGFSSEQIQTATGLTAETINKITS